MSRIKSISTAAFLAGVTTLSVSLPAPGWAQSTSPLAANTQSASQPASPARPEEV